MEKPIYKRHITGGFGENEATKYLIKKGYKIIAKNFLCKFGELDIIAKDKNEICIIEVKTRTSSLYGQPAEAVNNIKKKHLMRTAQYYLIKNKLENEFIRFDVIEVFLNNDNSFRINHIKQII